MLALLVLATATLSACAPEPEPEPTPTAAFASEEEAFAAAEETYRVYTDALNAQYAGLESSDPQELLTGLALESDIETAELLRKNNVRLEGEAAVASFRGLNVNLKSVPQTITAVACLDATNTRVVDSSGQDVTPTSRADVTGLALKFVTDENGLLISESNVAEGSPC